MSINKSRNVRKQSSQTKRSVRNTYKNNSIKKRGFTMPSMPSLSVFKLFGMIVLCVFLTCAFIVGIGAGTIWIYNTATTSDYFATQNVKVLGNIRLSRDMVQDYAGIHEGDNSLAISITKVEQALRKTPWVEAVSVKRILPNSFVITLNERMPSFWVKQDGVLFYADELGNIIAPVETENFIALPVLEVEHGAEKNIANLPRYLKDLKSGQLPIEYGAISAFKISHDKGLELYLDDREIQLCLELDSWQNNLKRLSLTIGDLARRNELSNVREIRAASGNVWVIRNT